MLPTGSDAIADERWFGVRGAASVAAFGAKSAGFLRIVQVKYC